ncbi:hypothetical protein ZWY2020_032153 [Hordeum vulgare]|nr:hypothetical protein ZWY2020_032153 [Hordeum vulgare]
MVVLSLACVTIVLIWVNTTRILVFLGQEPAISAVVGEHARWTIPSLLVYVPLQCHIRFLQSQTIVLPVTASSGATALCHPLVLSATCKNTWSGFSREAFKELRQFTALAMPSAMMICLEWWSFEVLVLLSALLPNPQLETSVLSICLNTGALLYMVPLGLSSSISTLPQTNLGQATQKQQSHMRVVMYMALSVGFVLALTMILLRNVWARHLDCHAGAARSLAPSGCGADQPDRGDTLMPPDYITSPSGGFAFSFRATTPTKFLLATWFRFGDDNSSQSLWCGSRKRPPWAPPNARARSVLSIGRWPAHAHRRQRRAVEGRDPSMKRGFVLVLRDSEFTTGRFSLAAQNDGNVVLCVDLFTGDILENAYWDTGTNGPKGNTTITFDDLGQLSYTLYDGTVHSLILPVPAGKNHFQFVRMDPDGIVRT